MTTCEVCNKTAPTDEHPCRFEHGCTCWYGLDCSDYEHGARGPVKRGN